MDRRKRAGPHDDRDEGSPSRHRFDRERVADQSRPAGELPGLDVGCELPHHVEQRVTVRRLSGRANPAAGGSCEPRRGRHPTGRRADLHGPWDNYGISSVPSNYDYSFRAGIFAGDYESVALDENRVYTLMTDARNGRSSGGPAGGATAPVAARPQPGVRAVGRVLRLVAVEPPRWRRTEQSEFERLALPRHAVSEGHEALAAARKQNSERPPSGGLSFHVDRDIDLKVVRGASEAPRSSTRARTHEECGGHPTEARPGRRSSRR